MQIIWSNSVLQEKEPAKKIKRSGRWGRREMEYGVLKVRLENGV